MSGESPGTTTVVRHELPVGCTSVRYRADQVDLTICRRDFGEAVVPAYVVSVSARLTTSPEPIEALPFMRLIEISLSLAVWLKPLSMADMWFTCCAGNRSTRSSATLCARCRAEPAGIQIGSAILERAR